MILPFNNPTQIFILLSIIFLLLQSSIHIHSHTNPEAMKIHPVPKKRNTSNPLSNPPNFLSLSSNKKLRRLPHVFSRVLELPFRSDADVAIEEGPDYFRFKAQFDGLHDVQAHTVEIHPGVIKIMVRESGINNNDNLVLSLDEIELDLWRFRLPESTRPELASAVIVDGELIVTVPKVEGLENSEDGNMWGTGNNGMGGRLVLVQ